MPKLSKSNMIFIFSSWTLHARPSVSSMRLSWRDLRVLESDSTQMSAIERWKQRNNETERDRLLTEILKCPGFTAYKYIAIIWLPIHPKEPKDPGPKPSHTAGNRWRLRWSHWLVHWWSLQPSGRQGQHTYGSPRTPSNRVLSRHVVILVVWGKI